MGELIVRPPYDGRELDTVATHSIYDVDFEDMQIDKMMVVKSTAL
jgi:hypothetical protein